MEKQKLTPERIREVVKEVLGEVTSGTAKQDVSKQEISKKDASKQDVSKQDVSRKPAAVVAIGSDHGGFRLKQMLKTFLEKELGLMAKDVGTDSEESVDYPDLAIAVARTVASGEADRGIVIDTMGIGSSIAANKVKGIRAALCHDVATAKNSRSHNDANVLALGSNVVSTGGARSIVREWMTTSFEGGRHARRVQKIADAERA
jgi:ribose 5-phosphate isomerase B